MEEDVAVLVLAAGKSSRMQSIKQIEQIDNKYLLEIILKRLKKSFKNLILCVLGANETIIRKKINIKNIHFISNKNFNDGLSSSIVTGVKYLLNNFNNYKGVLIVLGDQPGIDSLYFREMMELFTCNSDKIIASQYNNKIGVPAIFPKCKFDELLKLKGDVGAKLLLNNNNEEIIFPKTKTNLIDIDTKENLKNYIKNYTK